MNSQENINPIYKKDSHAIEAEIKRMTEFEWPLEVSAEVIPTNLEGKTVGDIGAGPNPKVGQLVELRGGKYVAVDRNFNMALTQKNNEEDKNVVQADIAKLPFRDGQFDILHTRFLIMNLPKAQREESIRELARVGKQNIVMDYDWKKFHSENPLVQSFIANARILTELAGTDVDNGSKLKELVQSTFPNKTEIIEKVFNRGPIKDYATLSGLSKSMQGIGKNLQNIEMESAQKENRQVNQELIDKLDNLIIEMKKSESEFDKISAIADQSTVIPYTSPDIVAVIF